MQSEDQASRNILNLRRQITDLNQKIAEGNQRTAAGTAAERAKNAETNRGIRAEAGLLRIQQQRQSQALAGLRQESGLLANVRQQTGLLTRTTNVLAASVAAVGFGVLANELGEFVAGSIRASNRVEGFRASLTALHGSATAANEVIERLRQLAESPGISFPQAVDAAVRLKTVGIEGELAFSTISELGNSLALVGSTDLSGILLGLTQIISAGKVTTEEIRQITERSGIAAQAIQNAFGSLIGDDIQQQLEARGQDVRDFVQILVDELAGGARASADTTTNAFSNLGNAAFELSEAVGNRLTPIVKGATLGLTGFIESITEGIRGTQNFTQVIAELNAELSRASGNIQLREAIDGGVEALEAFIRQSEAAIRNNSAFFGAREDAILTAQINQAREALEGYVGIQEQSIETEAELRAELARQETELRRIQGLQTDRNNLIAEQGASARQASRIYLEEREKEELAVLASIDELETKIGAYEAVGMAAEEATTTATEGTDEVTEATTEAIAEVQRLTDIYAGLTRNVQEYAQFLELINSTGASDFFRLASGEIAGYAAGIDTATASVTNHQTELDALTASGSGFGDLSDPLADYNAGLDTTSDVANEALGAITDVGEGVTRAGGDIDAAAANLRNFDVALERPVATIPRVTRAIRDFGGTAPDIEEVGAAVESTTMSVDELLDSIVAIPDETQDAADGAVDAFDEIASAAEDIEGAVVPVLDSITGGLADIREGARVDEAFVNVGLNIGEHLLPGFEIATAFLGTMMEIDNLLNTVNFQEGAIEGVNRAQGFQLPGESDAAFQRRQQRLQDLGIFDEADAPSRLGTGRTREGDAFLDPLSDSVLPSRRRRGTLAAPAPTSAPEGYRYNATLGAYEPIPVIFSEDASGGSGLGAPQAAADERVGIEDDTQQRILAIQTRAIEDRASNEQRLQDEIRGIADSVVAFHEQTEQRKVEISERATEDRQRIEQRLQDDIRSIADDVVAFHQRTQEQITAVQARASMDRLRINEQYNDEVRGIADSVVAFHEQTQARITAVQARASMDRLRINEQYNDEVRGIADSVVAFHEQTQAQITAVTERAAAQRLAIENRHSDDVQRIYDDVADTYGDSEAEKVAITERAAADRIRAEENYADTVQGIVNRLVDNVRGIQDQIVDAEMQAVEDRISAQMDYDTEVQGIYNNLADRVTSIQENLNDELDRIGERRVDSERQRLATIAQLNRETGESVSDSTLDLGREIQDLLRDAGLTGPSAQGLGDIVAGGGSVSDFLDQTALGFSLDAETRSRLEELSRQYFRNIEDIEREAARRREEIALQAAETQAGLDQQTTGAMTQATTAISQAEAGTGTTAAEALMNAVPPLDAMSMASMNLATTITTIDETLATDVGLFNTAIMNLETNAGISFEDALMQYTPSLSAMAEAGQTFADTIGGINTQELTDLGNVDTNFAAFVEAAGVTLPDALANASPPMTRLAIAMENLDVGIAGVNEREIDDIATLNTSFDTFVAMAGIPLTEALTLATPPMTRLAAAIETMQTGLLGIDDQEIADIMALTTGFDTFVNMAGIPLTEALNLASPPMTRLATAIETMQTGLLGIDDQEIADIMALTTGFDNFVAMAGIPLTEALTLATPAMTLLAQAVGRSETGIAGVDEAEMTDLALEDTRLADFIQTAGIDLPNALELSTPVMTRHAAALEGFNERVLGINTQESTDLSAFGVQGSVPPSDNLQFAAQMAAPPQTTPQAMMATQAQIATPTQPLPITGEVSIRGGVQIEGTVPVSIEQVVQTLVTNFPEGGNITLGALVEAVTTGQAQGAADGRLNNPFGGQ